MAVTNTTALAPVNSISIAETGMPKLVKLKCVGCLAGEKREIFGDFCVCVEGDKLDFGLLS
jgi:hypothetical protein